ILDALLLAFFLVEHLVLLVEQVGPLLVSPLLFAVFFSSRFLLTLKLVPALQPLLAALKFCLHSNGLSLAMSPGEDLVGKRTRGRRAQRAHEVDAGKTAEHPDDEPSQTADHRSVHSARPFQVCLASLRLRRHTGPASSLAGQYSAGGRRSDRPAATRRRGRP